MIIFTSYYNNWRHDKKEAMMRWWSMIHDRTPSWEERGQVHSQELSAICYQLSVAVFRGVKCQCRHGFYCIEMIITTTNSQMKGQSISKHIQSYTWQSFTDRTVYEHGLNYAVCSSVVHSMFRRVATLAIKNFGTLALECKNTWRVFLACPTLVLYGIRFLAY